jgi:hypothetical protein
MKCPKCGSEDIFENIEYDLSRCRTCQYRWTPWQQDEIERLRACLTRIKELSLPAQITPYDPVSIQCGMAYALDCAAAIAEKGLKGK